MCGRDDANDQGGPYAAFLEFNVNRAPRTDIKAPNSRHLAPAVSLGHLSAANICSVCIECA
jgi:hypothetical protein